MLCDECKELSAPSDGDGYGYKQSRRYIDYRLSFHDLFQEEYRGNYLINQVLNEVLLIKITKN